MQCNDPRARTAFSERLVKVFRAEHARVPFRVFFAYLMDGMIDPAAVDEIRRMGVLTCNFSCNNVHQFNLAQGLAAHFDYNLHAEKSAGAKFIAAGATPLWWPMASNPRYFMPRDLPRSVAVSFVGANYALRARYCEYLLESNIGLHVYGPGWQWGTTSRSRGVAKRLKYWSMAGVAPTGARRRRASAELAEHDLRRDVARRFPEHVHPPVSDDEMIALYSRSHVSLGFVEVNDQHDPSRTVMQHMHLREFEAPMSGALYCTGYTDELAEMFEPDKEVVTYRNQFELLDKVRFYLSHPEDAERIRRAGHARALRDHTYQQRFRDLFTALRVA
jgi:hypothetical protein